MSHVSMVIGIMKINVYAMKHLSHQVERAQSFCNGLKRHGIDANILAHNSPQPCDLAVFWGMHHSVQIRNLQNSHKKPWLVMERGYVGDRFQWTSLGYGGLNGHADFVNNNSPSDRWNQYFNNSIKPWHDGEYVLLAGQVLQDASIKHLRVDYQKIADEISKFTTLPIHFRKHPHKLCAAMKTPNGCITSPYNTIEEALVRAKVCVCVNSNSGVDAILSGTPVINLDKGSMVWELSQHDYKNINSPPYPDRQQWAHNIAYAQWLPKEIEDGTAWGHLRQKFTA